VVSLQLKYFDDPVAQCMQGLDGIDTREATHKCEYFAKLAQTIPAIPRVGLLN
jgi:hypothetical protein